MSGTNPSTHDGACYMQHLKAQEQDMNAQPLLDYLVLPDEITPFEREHVRKMNRVAAWFFMAHLPVFMLVAWLCDTGVVNALLLTTLALVGPLLAWKRLENPRHTAMVFGFTSMCMGGLLVHFGQGPMQIEMHFYFFVLLALLSMYGNPIVVLVAAVTVATHHLVIYAVLPSSVFNYDASVWVVLVHALFVVLESVASCYLARSFFDNVIGLERIVQQRTAQLNARNRDMHLVLDNVEQGLVTIDAEGRMATEHSSILTRWFGEIEPGMGFRALLARADENVADWFELSLEDVREGFMPTEMVLEQMPRHIQIDDATLEMSFQPVLDASGESEEVEKLLVVVTDITAELEHTRLEAERGEIINIFERIVHDKIGFLEFYNDANALITDIVTEQIADIVELKRKLHTLKGNSGIFGIQSVASICHAIETEMEETQRLPSEDGLTRLQERWDELSGSLSMMLDTDGHHIELDDQEYEHLLRDVLNRTDYAVLAERIRAWRLEPTRRRLERLGEQAMALATRLNKCEVEVAVEDHKLRTDPDRWRVFWSSCIHVLRNAVDHGLETPDERLSVGKPATAHVQLSTFMDTEHFVVEIADDGRGIDWSLVARKAEGLGLPHANQEELVDALFSDGFSTRDAVTATSGRGVGLAAVRKACQALGGSINVVTAMNEGTRFRFRFPSGEAFAMAA